MGRGAGAEISSTVKVVVTMDLIDRAALLKIFEDVQKTDPMIDNGRGYADNFINDGGEPSTEWFAVEDLVYKMPTIEAVPLEPLCEWLDKNNDFVPFCADDKADCNSCELEGAECIKKRIMLWMEGQHEP